MLQQGSQFLHRDSAGFAQEPGDNDLFAEALAAGDFDGDGIDEIGLHRRTTGFVYLRNTLTAGVADASFFYGDPGDWFVTGDWNGDGTDTVGLFRPGDATFYLRYENSAGPADLGWRRGSGSWLPFSGLVTIG